MERGGERGEGEGWLEGWGDDKERLERVMSLPLYHRIKPVGW